MKIFIILVITASVAIVNNDNVLAFQSPIQHHEASSTFRNSQQQQQQIIISYMSNNSNNNSNNDNLLPTSLQTIRSPSTSSIIKDDNTLEAAAQAHQPLKSQVQLETLSRILIPSTIASVAAFFLFPPTSLGLSYLINDSATFAVLSVDSSQFIQNFLTVTGLTFSILVGQTYYFMYQQQEAVFVSLFSEVTEAKSLLEQVALVCQGRRDMYEMCLVAVKRLVVVCISSCCCSLWLCVIIYCDYIYVALYIY